MGDIRVAALIPAYRADATIGDVVIGTRAIVPDVLVVDDGSGDATGARARAAGAEVLTQPENRGKGAALLAGMAALAGRGVTHVLTLDADGQHLPSEIPRLLAVVAAAPAALVVGVRRKEGFEISSAARFGNWIADCLMQLIAGQALPDTQSGFRVYPVPATLDLGAVGTRYDFETEILLRAARRGMTLVGVPVAVYYPPVAERVSHYQPWADTLRIIETVVRVLVAG
ncbi:MAG: glycosyltransferase [Candidatus Binatia bacterium]